MSFNFLFIIFQIGIFAAKCSKIEFQNHLMLVDNP